MAGSPSYEELRQKLVELEIEVREERLLRADLDHQLQTFRGLYQLALAMMREQNPETCLQIIVDQCRALLGADVTLLALHAAEQTQFARLVWSGIQSEACRGLRLVPDAGFGGWVTKLAQAYVIAEHLAVSSLVGADQHIIAAEGIRTAMAVPLEIGSKPLGVLCAFNRDGAAYSQADLKRLCQCGQLIAAEIDRKQTERELRENEERFRFMVETTGDAIYRLRYDSMRYDYLSPGIRNLTGYSPEEVQALGFSKLVARIDLPGQDDINPDILIKDRREGKTGEYRADYLVTTKGGESKWLRDHSFPWLDEALRLVGSVGILSDVTDYKRAEALVRQRTADLLASEQKYRTLVENVPLVVYRIGPSGEIMFVNHFVEELIGYSPEEIYRDPDLWTSALHTEDRAMVTERRQEAQREEKELIVEYRLIHRNGHMVYVVDHAIPVRTTANVIGNVDGIMMDVTSRVKLQEQLIQNEGIRTISAVSARLAHEIRNPLVSAGGFARRLLSSMSFEDPNREKVEIIVKEVGRLETILRMILRYIQPIELEMSPTDPNWLIEQALLGVDPEVRERNVLIQVDLAPHLPRIMVDPVHLEQALQTLLRNALRQMSGGATLTIVTSLEKDMFQLMMRYPTRLISRDDVEHFFYPFTTFKVDYQVVDLPMAKILVHKHRGVTEVKLEEPGEVSIRILLPV